MWNRLKTVLKKKFISIRATKLQCQQNVNNFDGEKKLNKVRKLTNIESKKGKISKGIELNKHGKQRKI